MKERCFRMKGSNPPIWGVHNVPLVQEQLPADMIASGYKALTFLVCPTSGQVLNEQ